MGAQERAPASKAEPPLIRVLDASQAFLDQQALLAAELKAAFFALAQARYASGAGKLGQSQFPGAMRASQRVHTEQGEGLVQFSLRAAGAAEPRQAEACALAGSGSCSPPEFSGMLASLAEQFQCETGRAPPANGAQAAQQRRDPLRWFGVMVPPALREAQTHFAAAAQRCAALCSQRAAVLASLRDLQAPQAEGSDVASSA